MSGGWWFQRDNETIVWEGSPRLSAAIDGIALGGALIVGALAAAVVVDSRVAVVALAGVGLAGWRLLQVQRTNYLITGRALWAKRGVMGQTVRRVSLSQVQNTAYSQSFAGSLFGYGTVTVEIAGGRNMTFRRIDDPEAVRRTVTNKTGDADSEPPGTDDQWRAILSVVREINTKI